MYLSEVIKMTLEKRLGESYNFDEISKRLDKLGSVDSGV